MAIVSRMRVSLIAVGYKWLRTKNPASLFYIAIAGFNIYEQKQKFGQEKKLYL